MNGEPFEAGKFAQSLRKHLFREHLGLMDDDSIDLQDPISEDFYRKIWIQTAETNTSTYDKVGQDKYSRTSCKCQVLTSTRKLHLWEIHS